MTLGEALSLARSALRGDGSVWTEAEAERAIALIDAAVAVVTQARNVSPIICGAAKVLHEKLEALARLEIAPIPSDPPSALTEEERRVVSKYLSERNDLEDQESDTLDRVLRRLK